jgi:hypothetical protein
LKTLHKTTGIMTTNAELGIQYKDIYNNDDAYNTRERGVINGYHSTQNRGFKELHKGAKNTDIAQLKKVDRKNLISVLNGDFMSKFTIGFEVEKNNINRSATKPYPLFAGFERDSSCGYEAVTNIIPLLPAGHWRNKIFSLMFDATKVIDDAFSPSNHRCGGHTTIGVEGMTGEEIANAMRKNVGIIYSLFRKRLTNTYCYANLQMDADFRGTRYQAVQIKGDVVEFRLVSRFQSVKQMWRRYELFYIVLDFSINNPNGSHNALLKKCLPVVKSMYNNDMEKVNEIMTIAKGFQKYLKTGKINRAVVRWVDPNRSQQNLWDSELRRNGWR